MKHIIINAGNQKHKFKLTYASPQKTQNVSIYITYIYIYKNKLLDLVLLHNNCRVYWDDSNERQTEQNQCLYGINNLE